MDNISHDCAICREPLKQNPTTESDQPSSALNREVQIKKVVKLSCKHEFHSYCIERWASNNPRCPLDRRFITTLPHSSTHLHRALLQSIEDNQIDDVREILLTGMLDIGQLSVLDEENPLIMSLIHEHWEISAELLWAGVSTANSEAQNTLGSMYTNGTGVEQDLAVAKTWYQAAADQDHVEAQYSLGLMYEIGVGGEQNYSEALNWYGKAANNGHPDAQNDLGSMYQNGFGVVQNYAEALKWYSKAADQGHAAAQNNLEWLRNNVPIP